MRSIQLLPANNNEVDKKLELISKLGEPIKINLSDILSAAMECLSHEFQAYKQSNLAFERDAMMKLRAEASALSILAGELKDSRITTDTLSRLVTAEASFH